MRLSAIAWICLIAVLLTACQSGSAVRSDSLSSLAPASYEAQHDRVSDVAWRLTVALADICSCHSAADAQRPAPDLCGYPIRVANQAELHASTNGQRVRITTGMLKFFESDDELAFVLAHELSHILLGHAGAFDGQSPKATEAEADRLGILIVSAADFDVDRAAMFPQRLAKSYPSMSDRNGAYPNPAERTAMIRTALRGDAGPLARVGLHGNCTE